MKGFLASCLAAVPNMKAQNLANPIHLAFSYDEEVGCVGVRGLLRKLAAAPVKPRACFVGEPTSMDVVVGHKGKRSVRVLVRGKASHSSLAPQGVNAVEWGALLVARIRAIADRLAADGSRDELYDMPFSTGHVGVFHGGTVLNIVPHEAEIRFEFRTLAADDGDALVQEVISYARDELEPRMKAVDPAAGFTFDVYAGFPGLDTDPNAGVTTLAKSLAGRNGHSKVAYGTEAGLFVDMAGIPTVIVGPGSITQAHKPDEYIEIAELERCAAFIDRLIAHCRA
jgi:acetylornithine deacetylase